MKVSSVLRSILLVLFVAAFCQAQSDGGPRGRGGPRDREGRANPFGPPRPAQILTRIENELPLKSDQTPKAKELFDTYEATVKALREEYRGANEDAEKWKGFREEMQAARAAGDQEKVREILERMRAARTEQDARLAPVRQQVEGAQKNLKDGMLALLAENQKPGFERIWEEEFGGKRRARVPVADPKVLKSVIDDMKGLSGQQKEKIEAAFKTYFENTRGEDVDKAVKAAQTRRLSEDVFSVLDEEQGREAQKLIRERSRKGSKSETPDDNVPPPSNP